METALTDSVGNYLKEIGRIPMLTPEQEIVLGRKVQKLSSLLSIKEKLKVDLGRQPTRVEWAERANCSISRLGQDLAEGKDAKNRLVVANLRLVVSIAKKYQGKGLDFLELVQEGNRGLIVAADKFQPKKGCKFSTLAYWWIRQAIIRAIQNQSRTIRLPIGIHEKLHKIQKASQYLAQNPNVTPTIQKIAKYCQQTP